MRRRGDAEGSALDMLPPLRARGAVEHAVAQLVFHAPDPRLPGVRQDADVGNCPRSLALCRWSLCALARERTLSPRADCPVLQASGLVSEQ